MNSITANFTAMLMIAGLILGCTNMKPQDFSDTEPKFELFDYFAGETRAWGLFENRFGTVKRQFQVSITGTIQDEILTLDEKFTYSDGEIDTRIWHIEKKSDSYYEGRANDVVGIAKGIASGNSLNWQYDLNLKVDDTTYKVHFNDWMFLQNDGVLINRAKVSKWGFEVGQVTLFFIKPLNGS